LCLFTGSIARSATCRYLSYAEADFEVFFAPQERHVAPMGVKFGTEEKVPSSMPNFTSIGAACRPCGPKNLKIGL